MPDVILKLRGISAKTSYGQKGLEFEVISDVLFNVPLPENLAVKSEGEQVTITFQGLQLLCKAAETALYLDKEVK